MYRLHYNTLSSKRQNVLSESFCAWFCEKISCQLCPNFWDVCGAYVDEIRVRLAENQPQNQVQERLWEYICYYNCNFFSNFCLSIHEKIEKRKKRLTLTQLLKIHILLNTITLMESWCTPGIFLCLILRVHHTITKEGELWIVQTVAHITPRMKRYVKNVILL